MNEEMYNILESCLQELENGVEIETILSRHPKFAGELRPILKASLRVKNMDVPAPSQEVIIRGRARLMQHVAELREGKIAPRKRMIPLFQRIALSFTLTATLLLSGTGLVGASSSALPGQKLYPVKRGWEDLRLFLTFNEEDRNSLEREIEDERLHEVDELLSDEEHMLVDFSGIFTNRNGALYVSEVQVLFPAGAQLPNDDTMTHIVGWTTEKGYVEVIRFEILQSDSMLPNLNLIPSPVDNNQMELPIDSVDEESTQPANESEQNQNPDEAVSTAAPDDHEYIGTPAPSQVEKSDDKIEVETEHLGD